MTIAVQSYTRTVPATAPRGHVRLTLATNAYPIVLVQVKLDGSQVVGSVPAMKQPVVIDLRDLEGLGFSLPRTHGTYNLTVAAEDSVGCQGETSAARPVTVQ